MKLTAKLIRELDGSNITSDIAVTAVKDYQRVYGYVTTVARAIWDLQDSDTNKAQAVVLDTVRKFGAGGEGTDAYKQVSSFKTILNRIGASLETPRAFRWKRDADGLVTDLRVEDNKPKADTADTGNTSDTGAPQQVEEKPAKVNTVKALVDFVMDNKPKRTKVSSVIIGLLAYVGKGGLVEVMTATQKALDKLESAAPAATAETEKEAA